MTCNPPARLASGNWLLSPLLSIEFAGTSAAAIRENFLCVGNWDDTNKVVFRYPVNSVGTLGAGRLFFDMTKAPGEDAINGRKVDERGNVYVSGPGGLRILAPEGNHLGKVRDPKHPLPMAWRDSDRRTLYLAAQTGTYRFRLNVAGVGAAARPVASAQSDGWLFPPIADRPFWPACDAPSPAHAFASSAQVHRDLSKCIRPGLKSTADFGVFRPAVNARRFRVEQ